MRRKGGRIPFSYNYNSNNRKRFTKNTKLAVLQSQNNICRLCGHLLDVWEYDHIDGNKANNLISNCQALCPNCHARKTKDEKSYSNQMRWMINPFPDFEFF